MGDFFKIQDEDLKGLKDKVVLITGCSSGIGLATVKFLLERDTKIVAGDLNPIPIEHSNLTFQNTNVTSWADLSALFALAQKTHGRIDHVFANAGITSKIDYLTESLDPETGALLEPSHIVLDVNLKSVVNTTHLALHYMRRQQSSGTSSIVMTASASSFQRFRAADYTVAKHGVLGLMRALHPVTGKKELPVRVNAIAPSWTNTGIVPGDWIRQVASVPVQEPDKVARSVAVLFADEGRHGQLIYSVDGEYKEIDELFLKVAEDVVGKMNEDLVVQKLFEAMKQQAASAPPAETLAAAATGTQ